MEKSRKVYTLEQHKERWKWVYEENEKGFRWEVAKERFEAATQFHESPWVDRIMARDSIIEFNKYPVFRGRICVEPPLGPNNKEVFERLWTLESCYRERWRMPLVAEKLGIPLQEAIEKYGPEGEFLNSGKLNLYGSDCVDEENYSEDKTLSKYPGENVPPSSQPVGYSKFHYWEEDATTGKVIREIGKEFFSSDNGSDPQNVKGYLAWDCGVKAWYPMEWLAYLGEVIFKPVGSVLNGELQWFDDLESMGTIRVVNSTVSISENFYSDPGRGGWGCDCPGCKRAQDAAGPLDWVCPTVTSDAFSKPNRDPLTLQKEQELFSQLPTPCTWQQAAQSHFICNSKSDGVYESSVLLHLPAAPPIKKVICTAPEDGEGDY